MMLKKILIFTTILCVQNVIAQIVSTVTEGNFHDGLAIDSQGNLYGSDFQPSASKTVYKYDTNGNVTVFATGFTNPNGIGINSQDEIYICDHFGNNIRKYALDGTLLMTTPSGQFTRPTGIKPIPNSLDMLVVEYSTNRIKRLASDGTVTTLYSNNPFTGFLLNGPAGITFIDDVPYIANFLDRKIFRFLNNTLTEITQLPSSSDYDYLGFITSANGLLFATHIGSHSIYTIDPNTGSTALFAGATEGNTDGDISVARFNGPNGIIADVNNNNNNRLYISEAFTKNLRIIDNALLSVSSSEHNNMTLTISPNPAKENFNIKLKMTSVQEIKIEVFDITGRAIFTKNIIPSTQDISIKIPTINWQDGTYVIKCSQGTKVINKKVVV